MRTVRGVRLMACAAALSGASAALGQEFNVDIGTAFGTPSAGYGAAAAQPGTWTNPAVSGNPAPQALAGLNGVPTAVTLANVNAFLDFSFDNVLTTGDDQALLDDLLDLGGLIGGTGTFVIAGLAPGAYDVYTYAWAPDAPTTFITGISVNGSATTNVGGQDWTGTHVEGATYAKHTATLAAGQNLTITTTVVAGFGSINGIQIAQGASVCYADCTGEGTLSVADFGCFQGKYVLGEPYADCNASGNLTVADFGCYQGKYVLGCP